MTEKTIDPRTGKPMRRSTGFMGWNTIFRSKDAPYMTRFWFGRLRLHIFHSGDEDQDPHDHPWNFWTFPFQSYVEEVTMKVSSGDEEDVYVKTLMVTPAWRFNFRPAEHCHRVLGLYTGYVRDPVGSFEPCLAMTAAKISSALFVPQYEPLNGRKLVTLVYRGKFGRRWGFLKNRDGKWCWEDFKKYIESGGSPGPCE